MWPTCHQCPYVARLWWQSAVFHSCVRPWLTVGWLRSCKYLFSGVSNGCSSFGCLGIIKFNRSDFVTFIKWRVPVKSSEGKRLSKWFIVFGRQEVSPIIMAGYADFHTTKTYKHVFNSKTKNWVDLVWSCFVRHVQLILRKSGGYKMYHNNMVTKKRVKKENSRKNTNSAVIYSPCYILKTCMILSSYLETSLWFCVH